MDEWSGSHSEKKKFENRLKIVLHYHRYLGVVVYHFLCTLLKVVGHYDLSVLPMSVMAFQKNLDYREVGGWGELSIQFFWGVCNFV